jgi:hypothetical protein
MRARTDEEPEGLPNGQVVKIFRIIPIVRDMPILGHHPWRTLATPEQKFNHHKESAHGGKFDHQCQGCLELGGMVYNANNPKTIRYI